MACGILVGVVRIERARTVYYGPTCCKELIRLQGVAPRFRIRIGKRGAASKQWVLELIQGEQHRNVLRVKPRFRLWHCDQAVHQNLEESWSKGGILDTLDISVTSLGDLGLKTYH